jgi:hypothetical protein
MSDPNPLAGMPLAASLASNMNESLQWMSRMWGGAAAGADAMGGVPGSMSTAVPSMLMPTFDPNELEKRIADLRTVTHWLDMNRTLLQTTIQTLEMQRNAIVAMQAMARSAQEGGAAMASAGAAAASTTSGPGPREAGAGGGEAPPFDPTIWWNALQEQFARVASAAIAEAQPPAEAAPPTPVRSAAKPPGP